MKSMGKRGDSYADAVSRVVEGLRGDAFIVAQELGREALSDPGAEGRPGTFESEAVEARPSGIEKLIEAMRDKVFPLTQHEARELNPMEHWPGNQVNQ